MDLTYTTKSGGSKKAIRVPFNPPLAGYEDVKGRLLQMKVDAEEALGMVRPPPLPSLPLYLSVCLIQAKNPTIDSFIFPASAWKTTLLIIALLYTTYAPGPESALYNPACLTAVLVRGALPAWGLTGIWVFLVAFHAVECIYTYSLCKRHQTPLVPTVSLLYSLRVWRGECIDVCGVVGFVPVDDAGVWVPCVHGLSQARTGGEDR